MAMADPFKDTRDPLVRSMERVAIELMRKAFHDYFYFHENYDIREGHRKRCNRWKGQDCSCGGDEIRANAAKYATPDTAAEPKR